MNRIRTLLRLATLTALLLWAGHALGGQASMVFALLFAGLMTFGQYWFFDKIVLTHVRCTRGQPARSFQSVRHGGRIW